MENFIGGKYEIMHHYLKVLCITKSCLEILKSFTEGISHHDGGTICVFADDPDENDPRQERGFPELIGFEGVGFFDEHYPEPLLISYQEFYYYLKMHLDEYMTNKSPDYPKAMEYLEAIRIRYGLKKC